MRDDQGAEQGESAAEDSALPADELDGGGGPADAIAWRSWSNLWQVPTIVLCLVLIASGLRLALDRPPEHDFDGALDQVDRLIADARFDVARSRLQEVIEPQLDLATETQQSRFHATTADWIYFQQAAQGGRVDENNRSICERYARAATGGFMLAPARQERWAEAAIDIGDVETAQRRLEELEAQALTESGDPSVRRRRNRVLRRLVERELGDRQLPFDTMMTIITDYYRDDTLIAPADDLWAICREAELRLEEGLFSEAVDHLLVDSRRVEPRLVDSRRANFGEIYTLLGRAYYHLGDFELSRFYLEQALDRFAGPEAVRGETLVLIGRIEMSHDRHEEALVSFDEVTSRYGGTDSFIPGLLGRAEVLSVLGRHDESLAAFGELRQRLSRAAPPRGVTTTDVIGKLIDRHDAAVVRADLDLALRYITVAESVAPSPEQVPSAVLERLAAVNLQIAMNTLGWDEDPMAPMSRERGVDPAARQAAKVFFVAAGGCFVRHFRGLAAVSDEDSAWARSLWRAADCYDLAGDHERATEFFAHYVAERSESDPNRLIAMLRLGHGHRSLLQYDSAAAAYEQLMADPDDTVIKVKAYAPLARTYHALGRTAEAEQLLGDFLQSDRILDPASIDYREALIELGALHHETGAVVKAIERLTEAADRYPRTPRYPEVLYRLADSHRVRADQLRRRIDDEPDLSPEERDELGRQQTDALESARTLFGRVKLALLEVPVERQDRLSRDMLRYAYFYEGDCAFALEDFDGAIDLYEQAAQRYTNHHSSMTAMIQIVNCHSAMGNTVRVAAAHQRAMVRLRQLPETAFEAPDALMNRAAWEQWLASTPLGTAQAAATGVN